MLDSDTKRKIDTLRDILVGKIPNPQSQVEQITTGLIYKFMDDMDQEALELGGEKSFFTGDYEKYAWKNLFDSKLGGEKKVKLYSEAVESMYLNPTAPQLFREIFKNAFLPFKDPSTLNMFLKEIDEFHYSHSEKLGDAFEYLLSFMGSQGDAGQFRTPRHIIDFIVEIINPQKHESVLDPACGSAGFLISSYKHILKNNTDKRLGDKLSSEDRKKVGNNLNGYDISPEMIRLSLVNMYLHGFQTPKIEEYDTLSSEDKWNEYYDVILANPPFFSPKGGIQPHNRFGVSSKKAEVLFTSYILDHLKPDGRAGIIIPEGIIFQTGTAYKELRKQLIENGLVGVISLPAGVFNPYSGVKTSILILDKKLNKERDSVFFAEIRNDGFDLGAQRRPIKENDLPLIEDEVRKFILGKDTNLLIVEKNSILETKNIDFQKSQYQDAKINSSKFEIVKIADIAEVEYGTRIVKKDAEGDRYPVYGGGGETFRTDSFNRENKLIISRFAMSENCVRFVQNKFFLNDSGLSLTNIKNICLESYLDKVLLSMQSEIYKLGRGIGQKNLHVDSFKDLSIPLPPLEVQQEIVGELEGYQKIIDGCKQVVENYKPTIAIDPSWEMVELGDCLETLADYHANGAYKKLKENVSLLDEDDFAFMVRALNLESNDFVSDTKFINKQAYDFLNKSKVYAQDVIITKIGDPGSVYLMPELKRPVSLAMNLFLVRAKQEHFNPKFLYFYLKGLEVKIKSFAQGAVTKTITKDVIRNVKVPLLDLKIQKEIVQKIEEEIKVIEGNKKLIEIYTQKTQDRINKVWGE